MKMANAPEIRPVGEGLPEFRPVETQKKSFDFSLPPKKVKAKTGIESATVNILQQVDVVGDAYNLTPIQRLHICLRYHSISSSACRRVLRSLTYTSKKCTLICDTLLLRTDINIKTYPLKSYFRIFFQAAWIWVYEICPFFVGELNITVLGAEIYGFIHLLLFQEDVTRRLGSMVGDRNLPL